MTRQPVLCLFGPTACGKTGLAVDLAAQRSFDLVSVDSALVYRGMDIGTAKPDATTLAKAPHRLIDIIDPLEPYSAARFAEDARREIAAIHAEGRIPLLVGGTMLYFRALMQGLSEMPAADAEIRSDIDQRAAEQGWDGLHAELAQRDPAAAKRIHPNDAQRIQRAWELITLTGQTPSELYAADGGDAVDAGGAAADLRFISVGLIPEDRAALHQRIAARFDQMMQAGFLDEVAALRQRGDLQLDLPSMRAVGYRQLWQHLDGQFDRDEAIYRAVVATRQLAKRQLTWLRSTEIQIKLAADTSVDIGKLLNSLDELIAG